MEHKISTAALIWVSYDVLELFSLCVLINEQRTSDGRIEIKDYFSSCSKLMKLMRCNLGIVHT
jgi:hypothetical protein